MTETIETAEMETVMVPVRITAGIMAITTAAETTEMTETAAAITMDKIRAEITAETETVMAIITAYLNVSRRHRVVLTELSRSRKNSRQRNRKKDDRNNKTGGYRKRYKKKK